MQGPRWALQAVSCSSPAALLRALCTFTSLQLIDEQILCVHGGLSPDIKTLDQIRTIERNQEIPHKGAFCDLVWSDPEDVDTWAISPRGAGWLFGAKVTNEVTLLLRATQPRAGDGGALRVVLSAPRALQDTELPRHASASNSWWGSLACARWKK